MKIIACNKLKLIIIKLSYLKPIRKEIRIYFYCKKVM